VVIVAFNRAGSHDLTPAPMLPTSNTRATQL